MVDKTLPVIFITFFAAMIKSLQNNTATSKSKNAYYYYNIILLLASVSLFIL